ncbi:MAG: phytanoyl-CoA dioxygenase family protein [Pseudomonadota bacterium]|jgi:ectoine hydroxylase-related dioxygenase (phytanoyl-CoA dioxygenase family)|nr:phytanoyl-CoA dioxygenase family protein [Pseudomonadota bacterium]
MGKSVSEAEIKTYNERGYVVPNLRLPGEWIPKLDAAVERLIAANPEVRPERLVSVHIDRLNDEGVRGDATFFELATDPLIVDAVAAVMGPHVVLWGCQVFCKPPDDGMKVPMHQDGHYWPIEPLESCTAWVAIDDCSPDNGCLQVVPGSHKARRSFQHARSEEEGLVLNQYVEDPAVDLTTAEDVALRSGEFSLHDIHIIHGSNPNTSGRRRAGVAIRYMPGTSLMNRTSSRTGNSSGYMVNWATRPLWLLRGENRAGNDLDVGHH